MGRVGESNKRWNKLEPDESKYLGRDRTQKQWPSVMDPSQSGREWADPTVFLVSPTSLCCYLPLAEPRNQKTRGPIDPVYPEQPLGAQSRVQKGVFRWINRRYPAKRTKRGQNYLLFKEVELLQNLTIRKQMNSVFFLSKTMI